MALLPFGGAGWPGRFFDVELLADDEDGALLEESARNDSTVLVSSSLLAVESSEMSFEEGFRRLSVLSLSVLFKHAVVKISVHARRNKIAAFFINFLPSHYHLLIDYMLSFFFCQQNTT
jgi:hypothetical protein